MPKNSPARTRAATRSRSSYSQPTREGGAKVPYHYPSWVTERRDPPPPIRDELGLARRNPRAFKMRKEGTPAPNA